MSYRDGQPTTIVLDFEPESQWNGELLNEDRAAMVRPLVDGYMDKYYGSEELETVVQDIVSNLCHLLHQLPPTPNTFTSGQILEQALAMFEEELSLEEDDQ